jgi:hypothetical protein
MSLTDTIFVLILNEISDQKPLPNTTDLAASKTYILAQ